MKCYRLWIYIELQTSFALHSWEYMIWVLNHNPVQETRVPKLFHEYKEALQEKQIRNWALLIIGAVFTIEFTSFSQCLIIRWLNTFKIPFQLEIYENREIWRLNCLKRTEHYWICTKIESPKGIMIYVSQLSSPSLRNQVCSLFFSTYLVSFLPTGVCFRLKW